ncbi:hypothetical protein ACP275_13G118900 [Erythranthe tilingii]
MDASTPRQFCSSYNNYSLSDEFFGKLLDDNRAKTIDDTVPSILNYDDTNSPVSAVAKWQFGVVPQMSELYSGFSDNFAVCDDYEQLVHQVFEPAEHLCSELVPNFNNIPAAAENWGIIQGKAVTKIEAETTTEVKVGRYSVEERKDRILRYLKKRNQRNFNKTIKYACRKTLADKRVRIRGRFAKNSEPCSEEETGTNSTTSSNDTTYCEENNIANNSFYNEDYSFLQMKYDEDYWFQEAIDNLVHLPYLAS